MRRTELLIPGLVLAGCVALVTGYFAQHRSTPLHLAGEAMAMRYRITIARHNRPLTQRELSHEIEGILNTIRRQTSPFDPDSEVSRFNATHSTGWFAVSPAVANLVHRTLAISHATGGLMDPTIAPLVNLWGFGPKKPAKLPPDQPAIDAAMARVSYHHLEVRTNPPAIRRTRPGVELNLCAVGEGYIVAQITRRLDQLGATDYLVQLGSQIQARGVDPSGRPWRVGIEQPKPGVEEIRCTIPLSNLAMATSGSYRNFVTIAGHTYCHVIDPQLGTPITHHLVSVTVLDADGVNADGLATALLVMGPDRARDFAEQQHLAVMFIEKNEAGKFVQLTTGAFNRRAGKPAKP